MLDNNESQNLDNLQRRAFELCLAIYRVTNLFPAGEVLIGQLREAAGQVVVLLAAKRIRDTILKVEELNIFLAIAQEQNWASPINFVLLKNAYCALGQAVEKLDKEGESGKSGGLGSVVATPLPEQNSEVAKKKNNLRLAEFDRRKRQLIDYFQKNKESTVFDLIKVIHGVSARTLRNDLVCLVDEKVIKKIGNTRNARYILI